MKKQIFFIIFLFLFSTTSFCSDYQTNVYPFIGYTNFHDSINLKDTFNFGVGLNQQIANNLKIDFSLGYMPSEYISSGTSVPVFYGSLNGEYLLPKLCCNSTPFFLAGISFFGFNGILDKGIEFGAGIYTLSNKNVEHKFAVKARYNPSNKESDILAIFSFGLFPINEAKPEPVISKKEIVKEPEIEEIPKEIVVIEEVVVEEAKDMTPPVIKEDQPIVTNPIVVEVPKKIEIIKPKKKVFLNYRKIIVDRFYLNSVTLGDHGENLVRVTAKVLNKDASLMVIITGYANNTEEKPNYLSLKRAERVKSDLIKKYNIKGNRITIKSGGVKPATDYNYLNRRAEIDFYYEK